MQDTPSFCSEYNNLSVLEKIYTFCGFSRESAGSTYLSKSLDSTPTQLRDPRPRFQNTRGVPEKVSPESIACCGSGSCRDSNLMHP